MDIAPKSTENYRHGHNTGSPPKHHRHTTDTSPTHHRHTTDILLTHHRHITDTPQAHRRHITDTSPTHHRDHDKVSRLNARVWSVWSTERPSEHKCRSLHAELLQGKGCQNIPSQMQICRVERGVCVCVFLKHWTLLSFVSSMARMYIGFKID